MFVVIKSFALHFLHLPQSLSTSRIDLPHLIHRWIYFDFSKQHFAHTSFLVTLSMRNALDVQIGTRFPLEFPMSLISTSSHMIDFAIDNFYISLLFSCYFFSRCLLAYILFTACWQFKYIYVFVCAHDYETECLYTTYSIMFNVHLSTYRHLTHGKMFRLCNLWTHYIIYKIYRFAIELWVEKMEFGARERKTDMKNIERNARDSKWNEVDGWKKMSNDREWNKNKSETKQTTLTRIENEIRFNSELCRSLKEVYTMNFCRSFIPMVFVFIRFLLFKFAILSSVFGEWMAKHMKLKRNNRQLYTIRATFSVFNENDCQRLILCENISIYQAKFIDIEFRLPHSPNSAASL